MLSCPLSWGLDSVIIPYSHIFDTKYLVGIISITCWTNELLRELGHQRVRVEVTLSRTIYQKDMSRRIWSGVSQTLYAECLEKTIDASARTNLRALNMWLMLWWLWLKCYENPWALLRWQVARWSTRWSRSLFDDNNQESYLGTGFIAHSVTNVVNISSTSQHCTALHPA